MEQFYSAIKGILILCLMLVTKKLNPTELFYYLGYVLILRLNCFITSDMSESESDLMKGNLIPIKYRKLYKVILNYNIIMFRMIKEYILFVSTEKI